MTRWTNRRATVGLAGTAAVAGLLLAGCSAGQIAETARKNPSIQGANAEAQLREGGQVVGSVAVRDAAIAYSGPEGYAQGEDAPLQVSIFNDTPEAVTVRIVPGAPAVESDETIEAESVTLVGGQPATGQSSPEPVASPTEDPDASESPDDSEASGAEAASPSGSTTPEGSASPTAPVDAAASATVEIPAGGFVVLNRENGQYLQLTGLAEELRPGASVPLLFQFDNGLSLTVTAPVAVPLTPVPRASPEIEELEGGH